MISPNTAPPGCPINLAQYSLGTWLSDASTFRPKPCVSTGNPDLDAALSGGWYEGESTVVFGPTSVGKSAFLANKALHLAAMGVPACIISLEMRAQEYAKLIAGIDADVPRKSIRRGIEDQRDADRLAASLQKLAAAPLMILDRSAFLVYPDGLPSVENIEALVRAGRQQFGWAVVFIDYIDKVKVDARDELQRTATLTAAFYALAQFTGAHIVCLAQTNKEAFKTKSKDGKRPIHLQDARGGVQIVADFDSAIGLSRPDWNSIKDQPGNSSPLLAVVLKARFGKGGAVELTFNRGTGKITQRFACAPEYPPGPYSTGNHVGGGSQ